MGSPTSLNGPWWNEQQKIGLFLQEKMRPGRVYSLGFKTGLPDCAARVERATATDAVISCQGEKSERYPNQKWVYDVKAKSLVAQFAYQPFATGRVFPNGAGAVFVASDAQRLVAIAFEAGRDPELRILTAAESAKWLRRVNVSEGTEGIGRKRVVYTEPEPITIYD